MKPSLAACAALAAGCAASAGPAPDLAASSLAASEQAFAAQSVRAGSHAAFLDHFSDDGSLLVHGEWVPALPALRKQAPAAMVLDWRPVYVEVARSGELGLSTGPWKITALQGVQPRAHGQFVSVWRREGERWKVVADIGIAHAGPALWDHPLETHVGTADEPGDAESLERAEADFARMAASHGERGALARHASGSVRLYREGEAPQLGRDAALACSKLGDAPRAFTVQASQVARSGELGYARGAYRAAQGEAHGSWLRVWRLERAGWRVVLDVANAAS